MDQANFTDQASKGTVDLIRPYGGKLVDLVFNGEEWAELTHYAATLHSLQLTPRSLCDIELMALGAFSPLDRFMGEGGRQSQSSAAQFEKHFE